jgi:hypothetical protein
MPGPLSPKARDRVGAGTMNSACGSLIDAAREEAAVDGYDLSVHETGCRRR